MLEIKWTWLRRIEFQEKTFFFTFEYSGQDKDFVFFIQLILFLGKWHIHKKKWTGCKSSFEHFRPALQGAAGGCDQSLIVEGGSVATPDRDITIN